jgi:energy-coupling factor transporter ATP-binding protein EcfA2
MYIKQIMLKNIRGFADLQFDLTRPDGEYAGWTVFTGDNGSGKSTLLKAIAIGLVGKDTARSLQPSFRRWIREGSGSEGASIQLEIVRDKDADALVDTGRAPSTEFPAKIVFKNGGKETTIYTETPESKKSQKYSTPDRTIWAPDARGWFSCGYGPFRRVFGASPEATRQMVAPTTERFVALSAGGYHTCGVQTDGRIDCWGQGGFGQTTVPDGLYTDVSAGLFHTCAIRLDGWSRKMRNVAGNDPPDCSTRPIQVPSASYW